MTRISRISRMKAGDLDLIRAIREIRGNRVEFLE